MRSKILGLVLGLGMVAATLAPAAACMYNNTTTDSGQAAPAQTAQSDAQPAPAAQSGTD